MNDLYEIEENSKKFCEFYGNKLNKEYKRKSMDEYDLFKKSGAS